MKKLPTAELTDARLITELTDEQSEKVVGGVGSGPVPGAGIAGWGAPGTPSAGHGLLSAGFSAPGASNPQSAVTVTVPGTKS